MPTAGRIKLLLLEDDPVSRAFLQDALAAMPVEVDCAESCAGAESFATTGGHALWIFDANLPDGHASDLLRRLRAAGLTAPALALTAEDCAERLEELSAAGFFQVLQKPIGMSALQSAIRRAIGGDAGSTELLASALWDEAQAFAAVGGRTESAQALRQLFLDELPSQVEQIRAGFAAADYPAIRAQLHRLKASCGFVGAARLLAAVNRFSSDLTADNLRDFLDVAAQQQRP